MRLSQAVTAEFRPGDIIGDTTVVASVFADDDFKTMTVLVIHREPPYFQVRLAVDVTTGGSADESDRIDNIVPAVELYRQRGGDY